MNEHEQPEPDPFAQNLPPEGTAQNQASGHPDLDVKQSSQWGPAVMTYLIFAGMLIVSTSVLIHFGAWIYVQVAMTQNGTPPAVLWPFMTLISGGIAAVASAPALLVRRFPILRRVGVTWGFAAVLACVFGFSRLIPVGAGETQLAVQAVMFGTAAVAIWSIERFRNRRNNRTSKPAWGPRAWAALAVGGVVLLPWLWSGAFGNVWETLYAAATAAGIAAVSGLLLGEKFWSVFAHTSTAKRFFGGGTSAGIVLLLVGSAAGGPGVGVAMLVVLSALGYAIAALQTADVRGGAVTACVVAPAAFGPLAYIDADEFFPLTFGPEFGQWHALAAAAAVVAAWLLGAGLLGPLRALPKRLVPALASVMVVAVGAVSLQLWAQPGFHGDNILVVMKDQADLSGIEGDRSQRLNEVHERLTDTALNSQKDLRESLDSNGTSYRPFYIVNAIEMPNAPFREARLEARDDVDRVLRSPQARPVPIPEPPTSGDIEPDPGPQPNIEQVRAPQAWEREARGEGITIGISDSGVDGQHPALAGSYRGGDSAWADPVNGTSKPNDPNGHGTHALGLALGADGIGVAPDAEWIGCANLPRNAGTPANYLACLEFMSAPYPVGADPFTHGDPQLAPHVLSNSWGCPQIEGCDETVMQPAVEALTSAGVFFVVAAGNSGPSCGTADAVPAHNPDAYSVGAVDSDNAVTVFSSRGPVEFDGERLAKPDISAPGQNVVSAVPNGGYGKMTGTSMSTPQVAGAVAVLWSAVPQLVGDIDATVAALESSAQPIDKGYGMDIDGCGEVENSTGAGVIDVDAAVTVAQERYADS